MRAGERAWFDDGKIGGCIRSVTDDHLEIEITHAPEARNKLGADKGINLPDTAIDLPALTGKDLEDLAFVVEHADAVGMSFVRRGEDVLRLHQEMERLGGGELGVILKIETRQAFEELPDLMLAVMRHKSCGIMIARGDLAVECGFERLAEVQEELLWFCEAAHMPVIWATQVLEGLAKTGYPSRAEVTDAAMGERAECVMLNKGPMWWRRFAPSMTYCAGCRPSGEENRDDAATSRLPQTQRGRGLADRVRRFLSLLTNGASLVRPSAESRGSKEH